MNPPAVQMIAAVALFAALAGCASQGSGVGSSSAATVAGAPRSQVSPHLLDRVDPPGPTTAPKPETVLPNVIELPATYRWQLINGKAVLVREADPVKVTGGGAMQIVAGNIGRGEIAFQPALMPQEIAAELARNRAAQSQMIAAFAELNQRVANMVNETRVMQQRNIELVKKLDDVTRYAHELEQKLAAAPAATPDAQK